MTTDTVFMAVLAGFTLGACATMGVGAVAFHRCVSNLSNIAAHYRRQSIHRGNRIVALEKQIEGLTYIIETGAERDSADWWKKEGGR